MCLRDFYLNQEEEDIWTQVSFKNKTDEEKSKSQFH